MGKEGKDSKKGGTIKENIWDTGATWRDTE